MTGAAELLARGFSVIPAGMDKRPLIQWREYQSRRASEVEISRWPAGCNTGIVTGAISGLAVLDADSREVVTWCEANLPLTPAVETARGRHYYFKFRPGLKNSVAVNGLKLDIRAEGGYVIGPGSVHETGVVYEWLEGRSIDDLPLADFPSELFTKQSDKAKPSTITPGKYGQAALASELSKLAGASEGTRNNILNEAAFSLGQLVSGGELDRGAVEAALIGMALSIGLFVVEARATIRSGLEAGSREPRTAPDSARRESSTTDAPEIETPGEWAEPLPLNAKIDVLPYPVDALPEKIRAAVEEVRDFVQAPEALISGSALAAVSLASQALADVERASRLNGPYSLNFMTIAESGERKTSTDGYFMTAIRNYENEQAELAKPELKRYEAEAASWASKRAGILDAIKSAAKAGNPCDTLEAKLHDLQREEPIPPKIPRLIYHDATQEALVKGLTGWPSGGVISSEAGAVFGSHGMGQDSLMRNLSTYNILWDGGTLRFDRRTEGGSFTLKGARLTVSLQVQGPTIKAFFDKAGDLARGTGFLARFLIAWPDSTQGTRFFKEAPAHWPALAAFHTRISELLNMPAHINEDGSLDPQTLTFSPGAKAAWVLFHDTVEGELNCGGELTDVRDVASKAADNVARLAALFHVFENGLEGSIEAVHIEAAGRIVAWHLNEARRFFGELAISSEAGNVARLDAWLLEYCRAKRTDTVSTRTISQYGPGALRKKENLESAIYELIELDRVRLLKDGKQKSIQLNPSLIEGAK